MTTFDADARADDDGEEVVISADGRRIRPVKSLVRALRLMETLAAAPAGLGLTSLAAEIGASKTATYNLLSTLEIEGMARRDDRQRYFLGWRLLEYGEAVRGAWSLGDQARQLMVELAERIGETVVLAILDGTTEFCVEMVESARSLPIDHGPGRRTDPLGDAAGRVLLAFSEDATSRSSDSTVAAELEGVRHDGWAVVPGSSSGELTSVAAPISDYRRRTIAALAVVGPPPRLPAERCAQLTPMLIATADAISATVGGRGGAAGDRRAPGADGAGAQPVPGRRGSSGSAPTS